MTRKRTLLGECSALTRPGGAASLIFLVLQLTKRGFSVAETTKLSVGQALEKLRGTEAPKAKMARQDEKIQALDEETQRLRAMRRRLERDQRPGSPPCDTQEMNVKRATKVKISGSSSG